MFIDVQGWSHRPGLKKQKTKKRTDQETAKTVAGFASGASVAPASFVTRTAHNVLPFSQHLISRGTKNFEGVMLFLLGSGPFRCKSASVVLASTQTSNGTPQFGFDISRSTSRSRVAPRRARTRALPASAGYLTRVDAREARITSGSSSLSKPNAQYTTRPRTHRAESSGDKR